MRRIMNRMIAYCTLLLICCVWVTAACAKDDKGAKIIHDAEYYILEAQNGKKWADQALVSRRFLD